jgi:tetratricopeptide (TPR) repeat protein
MGGWPQFRADEPPGGPAEEYRALLEEALEHVGEEELALRARLLSHLADQISMRAREAHSQRALALARDSGDPEALFRALYARLTALLGPDDVARRLELATELLDLAIRRGSREKVFVARESRIRSLMALGDIPAMDREIEACDALAEELRLPVYRHSLARFRLARALADGRLDEAERLNRVIAELGRKSDDANAEFLFDALTGWIRYLRGDLPAARNLAEALVGRVSFLGAMPWAFAAFLYAEIDEPEPARRHFERVAEGSFADVPRDEAWLITLALASEACAYLGDRRRAEPLYELLLPHADLLVSHQHIRVYMGSMHYVLGRLAQTRGEREGAAAHYEAALESSRRIGARPHLARSQRAYAQILLAGEPVSADRRRRARELLEQAQTTARELGMNRLLEQVRQVEA